MAGESWIVSPSGGVSVNDGICIMHYITRGADIPLHYHALPPWHHSLGGIKPCRILSLLGYLFRDQAM
jgi:hypothetical protein